MATRLSGLPYIKPQGGLESGVAAALYTLGALVVLYAIILAIGDGEPESTAAGGTESADILTATQSQTIVGTSTTLIEVVGSASPFGGQAATQESAGPVPTASRSATPTQTRLQPLSDTPASTPPATQTARATPSSTPADGMLTVTVTDVVDGDTVDIRFANGSTDTVRLLGVDTPETYGDTSPSEFEGVPESDAGQECLSAEAEDASDFTTTDFATGWLAISVTGRRSSDS